MIRRTKTPSAALARLRAARKRARERRGVALVMVLGAITVLTVFLVELQEDTSASLSAALSERDSMRAEYAAKSAVNLGRLLVASEPSVRRALQPLALMMGRKNLSQIPVWAFSDKLLGPFRGAAGGEAFAEFAGIDSAAALNTGLGDVTFEIRVVDEDSKLNLNIPAEGTPLAQHRYGSGFVGLTLPTQYDALFEAPDGDGQFSDRIAICSAIADWTDFDENQYACNLDDNAAPGGGTEDSFYDGLGLGYRRKNAPFDSLDELRLVRGVSDDFWSTFVDPDPTDPDARVMSVWGQGKVNVNTANAMTLAALVCANAPDAPLCLDPVQLESFIMIVTLVRNAVPGVPIFNTPKGFTNAMEGKGKQLGPIFASLGIEPVVFRSVKELQKQISTESRVFSVYADGIVKGYKRETRVRVHSVIDFRSASELGAALEPSAAIDPNADPNDPDAQTESGGPPSDEERLKAAASDPAGVMLYYRLE
jgi:general secretion pathway protein K